MKRISFLSMLALGSLVFITSACQNGGNSPISSKGDYKFSDEWTEKTKEKILSFANGNPTSERFDSLDYKVSYILDGKRLKNIQLAPKFNAEINDYEGFDTLQTIYFSEDEEYQYIVEHCGVLDYSFEVIRHQNNQLGTVYYKDCDGNIIEKGYRYNGNIGVWKKFDANGKVLEEKDYGNAERLEELKNLN